MANPSTIWAQLSFPNPPAGAVPFVFADNASIVSDVGYFWFNDSNKGLSVNCPFDQTGTDSINSYYNQDAYWPWSNAGQMLAVTGSGVNAAHTVSSSRGTGPAPAISLSGDFIGKFSAWCYTGTPAVSAFFQEMGGMLAYAVGTYNAAAGIGGELRFFTKQDNGPQIQWLKINNVGSFLPMAPLLTLGIAGNGGIGNNPGLTGISWYGLYLAYTLLTNTVAAVTSHTPIGKVQIPAGNNVVIVTNMFCTSDTIVQAQLETLDATALYVTRVTPTNGSFSIFVNANATGNVVVNYVMYRTST